jgi:hypothetical protein
MFSPIGVVFTWPAVTGSTGFQVYRKAKEATGWGSSIASLPGNATEFIDNTISVSDHYEYRIYSGGSVAANSYVWVGIDVPATEHRGKLILLIDSMFNAPLQPEIARLITDLTGDGWQVISHMVSRFSTPPSVKGIIATEYNADPQGVKAVFLLGHIPVPYSGFMNPDGHPDHKGAWPADGYYADFTTVWTDQTVNDSTATRPQNRNVPGDGKFDQNTLSTNTELQIGRVDFHNLPAFSLSEVGLMKQYLDKNHEYRHKIIDPKRRALIDDNFGWFSGEAFSAGAWRNFTAMFHRDSIISGDYFGDMASQSYLWSYGCGAGSYTNCNGVGNTAAFATNAPQSVFTMLFGSYFGDWDSQNNLLRAPLASAGWGLASTWSGRPHHCMHHMALGETIGYSIWRTMRNSSTYDPGYGAGFVSIALMGDPTLRMHVVAPPKSFKAHNIQNAVNLTWLKSPDFPIFGYYVYKHNPDSGKYIRISGLLSSNQLIFTDPVPYQGMNRYMLRAVKIELSNSGFYHNLSQGIFDSVYTSIGIHQTLTAETPLLSVWPNPASGDISITFSTDKEAVAEVKLADVTGKTVLKIANGSFPAGTHLLSSTVAGLKPGLYLVMVTLDGVTTTKKLLINALH